MGKEIRNPMADMIASMMGYEDAEDFEHQMFLDPENTELCKECPGYKDCNNRWGKEKSSLES